MRIIIVREMNNFNFKKKNINNYYQVLKRNYFIIKEELMQDEPSQLLDIIGVVDIVDNLSSN